MRKFAKWIPAVLVVAIVAVVAVLYDDTLVEWFKPMLGSFTDGAEMSNRGGSTGNTAGSMTKGESMAGSGAMAKVGPFDLAIDWAPMPPQVGINTLKVHVLDESRNPVQGAAVQVNVEDVGPLREIEPGVYSADVELAMAGDWEILGDVRTVDLRHGNFVIEFTTGAAGLSVATTTAGSPGGEPGEVAYWTCPMHPSVRASGAGPCPICGMDLVPVTQEEIETGVIIVDAQRRQLIGVKTALVRREELTKEIRTVGTVLPDETKTADVSLKFEAWIGEVYADFEGKYVEKGQPLFTFYSPELWTAQEEYIGSYRRRQENPTRKNRLLEAAETRLKLWGISESEIIAIRERGTPIEYLPYLSPVTGTILEKNVVEGSAVQPGQLLYRVADLSSVWIDGEIYEYELPLVEEGQEALITLSYLPDVEIVGALSYIYPYLDPETRTARIRFEAPNPKGVLKPDMYANVALDVPLGERLVVPEDAIIYAGKSRVAFVDLGEGRLEPRRIKTGVRTDEVIEVIEGLDEGEEIVTSANFLIASESRLKSGIDKW